MAAVIEVQDLVKKYEHMQALSGVSFVVEKGEIFGLLGPNGAGKTTTLEIIETIRPLTSGVVKILGFDVAQDAAQIKEKIGVQLQSSEYFPLMTLRELITMFASLYNRTLDVNKLLAMVNLEDKADEQVKNLSGGQRQRFTIATSLVNNPEILFLDEPTTGLDPSARRSLWDTVRSLNQQGITIVLTTHYMEEAEFLCDRVAILDHGKILTINNPRSLIDDLRHTTQVSFFVKDELPEKLWEQNTNIEKVYSNYPKVILELKSLDGITSILNTLKQNNVSFTGFTVKTATLEDVYLDLTGHEMAMEHTTV